MGEHIRLAGVLLIWFSLTWGMGLMSHIGFKNNPRQRKVSLGAAITKLLTFGAVEGEVAIIPTLLQLNALLFLIWGIVEYVVRDFERPTSAFTVWLIGFVACALLTPLMNRRK